MTLYELLGVNRDASPEQIKSAYRAKSMQHHPDRGGDSAIFNLIQKAYDTLKDSNKRSFYDKTGRIAEEEEKNLLQEAFSGIASVSGDLIERFADNPKFLEVDFLLEVKNHFTKMVNLAVEERSKYRRSLAHVRTIQKKISLKNGCKHPNILLNVLKEKEHIFDQTVKKLDQDLELLRLIVKLLQDYTYRSLWSDREFTPLDKSFI